LIASCVSTTYKFSHEFLVQLFQKIVPSDGEKIVKSLLVT
jgi:hypothetical protein